MKLVIFYLSDHGFGHAARNIPIITELLAVDQAVNVIVKTGIAQGEFIQSNFLEESRLSVIKESMDVGLVLKSMSFELDVPVLEERVTQYIESWENRIKREVQFLIHLSCQFKSDHYLSQTKQLEGVNLIQLLFS